MNINRNAPIVSAHEIAIGADIPRAQLTRLLAGTVLNWETAGFAISSTVAEVTPSERIGWSGEAGTVLGIYAWTLTRSTWMKAPIV